MKTKTKGSALLLTTILLFVVLSMVASLSYVTVMEQKMSQKTKSSVGAFYNSESGIEWALNQIATSSGPKISDVFPAFSGSRADCPASFGGANTCQIYLLDADGKIITDQNSDISLVRAVRSVGTQGNETTRAIEAAVAATGGGGCCYTNFGGLSCAAGFDPVLTGYSTFYAVYWSGPVAASLTCSPTTHTGSDRSGIETAITTKNATGDNLNNDRCVICCK